MRLLTASIAKRMSWASKRETTRTEDIAYCPLGIFGINMPLLYGEGLNSFRRLQEEFIKSSSDESIFAWQLDDSEAESSQLHMEHSWLALKPSYFQSCSNIIPDELESPRKYSITNLGIEIDLPLMVTIMPSSQKRHLDTAKTAVVLHCRAKHNLQKLITFSVKINKGNTMMRTNNMYETIPRNWIDDSPPTKFNLHINTPKHSFLTKRKELDTRMVVISRFHVLDETLYEEIEPWASRGLESRTIIFSDISSSAVIYIYSKRFQRYTASITLGFIVNTLGELTLKSFVTRDWRPYEELQKSFVSCLWKRRGYASQDGY
jgi:hypothetical protein